MRGLAWMLQPGMADIRRCMLQAEVAMAGWFSYSSTRVPIRAK